MFRSIRGTGPVADVSEQAAASLDAVRPLGRLG